MAVHGDSTRGEPGDWLEARSVGGGPPRRGQIERVLGRRGHARYLVRWDEAHESIVYPADGVSVVPHETTADRYRRAG